MGTADGVRTTHIVTTIARKLMGSMQGKSLENVSIFHSPTVSANGAIFWTGRRRKKEGGGEEDENRAEETYADTRTPYGGPY